MKRAAVIILAALSVLVCSADTNELERRRVEFLTARKAYMDARKAAGLTNAAPRRVATPATRTTFNNAQRRFFDNRRICIARDTETIPGSVITTWYRNGRLDTKAPPVVTNVLHNISGSMQSNPLQARIAELSEQYQTAIQRATSAEARAARADALKAWLIEQRDKSPLQTSKAIYQAILNKLEE